MKHLLKASNFNGSDPIAIIPFLSAFKKQYNFNRIAERGALLLLPNFSAHEAREHFETHFDRGEIESRRLSTYCSAVVFLPRIYATDQAIKAYIEESERTSRHTDETELQFAGCLRIMARRRGLVFTEEDVVARVVRGISKDLRPLLRVKRGDLMGSHAFIDNVKHAAAIDDDQRALRAREEPSPRLSQVGRVRALANESGEPQP